ncbi:hypothetical protein D3C72_1517580 [compost metagenome]
MGALATRDAVGQELAAAAAKQHVQAILERGVVAGVAGRCLRGDIVLAVAVADVRESGRRRRVGHARGGHRADRLAGGLGQFQHGHDRRAVAAGTGAVAGAGHIGLAGAVAGLSIGRHRDDLVVHLHAGHVGRHRRCAVGGLRVVRIRLHARGALERLHVELAGLAILVDARSGDGGRAHAVAQEEDDILGLARGLRRESNAGAGSRKCGQAGTNDEFHGVIPSAIVA